MIVQGAHSVSVFSSISSAASSRGVGSRGGSRGPSRGASKQPAASKDDSPPAEPKSSGAAKGRGGAAGDAVDRMVRNYAGVGKRTAEVLVEHFGAGVFEIIDSNPDRLTEVITETRAKAVVAARAQEREG